MENGKQINFKELPCKKKILITNRIGIFSFLFLMFAKISYDKIYFLEIEPYFRNKKILLVFKILGIEWLNYQEFNLNDIFAKKLKKSTFFCDKYSLFFAKKVWINSLSIFFLNKDLLAACINSKIKESVSSTYEIMEIASMLQRKNRVTLFLSNNFFFKTINKKYFFKNLNLINFDIFKIFSSIWSVLAGMSLYTLKNIFLKLSRKKKKYRKYRPSIDFNKFRVAYFPHKGIYNRNKIKDLFYLKKVNSNFNKKNIAHIEWCHSDLTHQSQRYYLKKKIPLFFWDAFSFKKKSAINVVKFFIFKFKLIFNFIKFSIFLEILTSAYQIFHAKEKLTNNFPNLKYVLAGYDVLLSNEIAAACRLLDVKVIAVQDRILVPSWSHTMCYDYYFALGPSSKKILKKRMNKTVKNIYSINILKNKNFIFKKNINKLKCLVIDYHSLEEKKWYSNGRTIASWKINFNFYQNILSLSKQYPNISFLIKSKNYVWCKHKYFKSLLKNIYQQKNIKILKNKKKWTSEYSINFADFAIAKYSSLSDQMLYMKKPIIIFNEDGFPGEIFDFSSKILTINFKQLKNRIDRIVKSYFNFNISLSSLRKKLFYYQIKKNSLSQTLRSFDRKLLKSEYKIN
jgi:hypothetical protein